MFVILYISTSGQFSGPANSIGHIVGVEILISFSLVLELLRTLTSILDDYFEGYYSEKMVEAQVGYIH